MISIAKYSIMIIVQVVLFIGRVTFDLTQVIIHWPCNILLVLGCYSLALSHFTCPRLCYSLALSHFTCPRLCYCPTL